MIYATLFFSTIMENLKKSKKINIFKRKVVFIKTLTVKKKNVSFKIKNLIRNSKFYIFFSIKFFHFFSLTCCV